MAPEPLPTLKRVYVMTSESLPLMKLCVGLATEPFPSREEHM